MLLQRAYITYQYYLCDYYICLFISLFILLYVLKERQMENREEIRQRGEKIHKLSASDDIVQTVGNGRVFRQSSGKLRRRGAAEC